MGGKIRPYIIVALLAVTLLVLWQLSSARTESGSEINVYAASSLRDVLTAVGEQYEVENRVKVRFNFAGSNVLAQQIAAANGAMIFISANQRWMDFVEQQQRTTAGTRRLLLSNRIVVVAHVSTHWSINDPVDLASLPIRFFSLGDPDAVPAGLYAKNYLSGIDHQAGSLWEFFLPKMAPAPDVRAALNLVASDPAVIGVVYRTDAIASEFVRILYEIPEHDVAQIKYLAAMVNHPDNSDAASSFFKFLFSDAASKVFEAHGFIPVQPSAKDA